jgi:hypothetical protein
MLKMQDWMFSQQWLWRGTGTEEPSFTTYNSRTILDLMLQAVCRRSIFCLLGECIDHIKRDVDAVSQELMELHLCLAGDLFAEIVDLIDSITAGKVSCVSEDGLARHCKKFQCVHKTQQPPFTIRRQSSIWPKCRWRLQLVRPWAKVLTVLWYRRPTWGGSWRCPAEDR